MLIMLPMWMNFLLRTYSWMFLLERTGLINTLLPLFGPVVFRHSIFQMINTQGAIVLGMVYNFLPFMILPIFSVMEKIDPKVIEAGQDLGANSCTVFRRCAFPSPCPASSPASPWCSSLGVHLCHLPSAGRRQEPAAGRPH